MPEEGVNAHTDASGTEPTPVIRLRARRLAWAYLAVALGMLPWIAYLAVSLPGRNLDVHYRAAWVGFDCILLVALAGTAYLAFRVDPRVEIAATVTATLLLVDAWFDVTTSGRGEALLVAVVLAVFAELPAAAFSLYVAHLVGRRVAELANLERSGPGGVPGRRHHPARPPGTGY